MILVFDLDDTLYDELTFVRSGFRAVAEYGDRHWGWDAEQSYAVMLDVLARQGRGAVFDRWLSGHGVVGRAAVQRCVRVYRHHEPRLRLFPVADELLRTLARAHRLYIVTDGHKVVQANKIGALELEPRVARAYITHRYGIRNAKPSTHCFELIRRRESCRWSDMAYIGDNPAKDFVNLNPLGVQTVRVLTGSHRDVRARAGYDARHTIPDLEHFAALVDQLHPPPGPP